MELLEKLTEHELLLLAAEAADIDTYGMTFMEGSYLYGNNRVFNPLTDDGAAMRLAVKLGIDVQHFIRSQRVEAWKYPYQECSQEYGNDPYAATRLAIVTVAAQIGKAMQNCNNRELNQ